MNKRLLTALLIIVTTVLILVLGGCEKDISSNPPTNETTAETTEKVTADTTKAVTTPDTETPKENPNIAYDLTIKEGDAKYFYNTQDIYNTNYFAGEYVSINTFYVEFYDTYLLVNGERITGSKSTEYTKFLFPMPACDVVLSIELELDPTTPQNKPWEDLNISEDEWNTIILETDLNRYGDEDNDVHFHSMIKELTESDSKDFAKVMYTNEKVYEGIEGMEIAEYRIYAADVPAKDDPAKTKKFPAIDIEITKSNSEFFSQGKHTIVFDYFWGGGGCTFSYLEDYEWYSDPLNYESPEYTEAQAYVHMVHSDDSFESILGEDRRQGGIAGFIIMRLNTLTGYNSYEEGYTEDEIRDYAEKYLGIAGDTIKFDEGRTQVLENGKHQVIPHGMGAFMMDFVSEEVRDGITIVTVDFFADHSKTVLARRVEFHFKRIDNEYAPIKTVIIKDSGLSTAGIYF